MKWTYSVKNKLVASAALLSLCLLVLLSNYLDRAHSRKVKDAISTLYEDRIVVQDYILDMTSDVYLIKETFQNYDQDSIQASLRIDGLFSKIKEISMAYLETEFTKLEETRFDEFLKLLESIENYKMKPSPMRLEA